MKRVIFSIVCISILSACSAGSTVSDFNDKLIQAAKDGKLLDVQTQLFNGAGVNAKDKSGVTALFFASEKGHTEIVKLLLEKGADINVKRTTNGATSLMIASQNGHTEVVQLLLAKGADVNLKDAIKGVTALWIASQNGHTDIVKLLLEKGADAKTEEKEGINALWIAAYYGHAEVVKLLLEKGLDVNGKPSTALNRSVTEWSCGGRQAPLGKGRRCKFDKKYWRKRFVDCVEEWSR